MDEKNEKGKPVPTDVLKRIIQIGIVVEDLEHQIEGMRQVYGLEPTFMKECKYPEVRYRGEVVDSWARIASYDQFGVQLEFMQPMGEGDSVWRDFLEENPSGHAIHHIRFNDVEDNDQVTELMAERGVELYQEGDSIVNPDGRFTYYDTVSQLGFVTEIVTAPK